MDRFADGGEPKKLAFQESPYKNIYYEVMKLLTEAKKNKAAKHSKLIDQLREAM